jgi:cytochrome c-type biogenesis protein
MAKTVCFILGFSAVFIVLSVLFSATFSLMGPAVWWINLVSGTLVIVLGLNIIFNFLSFLNYEKRLRFAGKPDGRPSKGFATPFLLGGAFGAGWTPCVGPVLAGILLLAAQDGGIPKALLYLACYSAGLGLPFLLASVFFNGFIHTSAKLRPRLPLIRKISGALLTVIGVLIITGQYQKLNALTARWQESLSNKPPTAEPMTPTAGPDRITLSPAAADTFSPEVVTAFTAAGLPVARTARPAFDFTLPLLDGSEQPLSGLQGQVVFLNFWATWCGPCRIEMPSMEALYQSLKDRGFTILAVNGRENPDEVSAFMRENKLTFPTVLDRRGAINYRYGVQAIPTTYILDKRGMIVSRMVGSIEWNQPKIVAALETLLQTN